jgi:hypothetical protein
MTAHLKMQIRNHLGFLLRQASGGTLPARVPMTPVIKKMAEEEDAQKIYDELLAERAAARATRR